jgi:glutaredoxin
MKKIILGVLIIIAGVVVYSYFKSSGSDSQVATVSSSDSVILFYGRECPHCQIVEDFISKNNVKDKVQFSQAEIFHNQKNSEIFVEKEKACGVTDGNKMGVPFLVADGKCYSGQEDVIKYFQDKMGEQ